MTRSHELLEHTADVGIRATGTTPEEVFEAAAEGLAEVLGAWAPGEGMPQEIRAEAGDREALLVAWLDELLYLQEATGSRLGGFEVHELGEGELTATVRLAPGPPPEAQHVKAATYHRLRFVPEGDGWVGEVYLDV